ncbi:hypothetical protein H0H81_008075, partial [Sphagnurus paluster]
LQLVPVVLLAISLLTTCLPRVKILTGVWFMLSSRKRALKMPVLMLLPTWRLTSRCRHPQSRFRMWQQTHPRRSRLTILR